MNNEIKEILDYISDRVIEKEKWNKVKDYITNLQQDNEMYAQLKDEYEEEIKEANDSITWWTNRFKAVERDNRELKQENERLKELSYIQHEEYKKLFNHLIMDKPRERIKKAIEYINKLQENDDIEIWREDGYWAYILNILQNGSEEK